MKENREEIKKRIICELRDIRKKGIAWIQKEYGIGFSLAKEIYYECEEDVEEYERTFFNNRYPLYFFAAYFNYYCSFDCIDIRLINKDIDALLKEINRLQEEYNSLSERDKKYGHGGPILLRIKIIKLQILMSIERITLLKPDIYNSLADVILVDHEHKTFLLPLVCLNRMNLSYANKIVEEREKAKFTSYEDLRRRVGLSSYRIEELVELGIKI